MKRCGSEGRHQNKDQMVQKCNNNVIDQHVSACVYRVSTLFVQRFCFFNQTGTGAEGRDNNKTDEGAKLSGCSTASSSFTAATIEPSSGVPELVCC